MNNFSSFQSQLFRGGVNPNSFSFVNKTAYGITLDPSGGSDYVSLIDGLSQSVANAYQINRTGTDTFLVVDYSGAALRAADFLPTAQSNATIYVKYKHNDSTTNQSAFSHLFPSTFSHLDICGTTLFETIETIEPGQSFDVKWLVAGADLISYAIAGVADSVTLPKTGYLVNTYEKQTITLGSDASSGIIQFAVNDVSLATQVYVPYRYDVRTGLDGNLNSIIIIDNVANKTVLQYPGFHFFDVSGESDFENDPFDFYTGPNGSGSNYTINTFETTSKYTALLVDQDTPNLYYHITGGAFLNLSKYDAKYSVKVVTNVVGQSVYAIDLCGNGTYYNQPDISFSSGNVYLFELDNSSNDPFNLVFGTTVDGAIDTTYAVTTMDTSNKKVAMLDLAEYIGDSMVYFEDSSAGMGYVQKNLGPILTQTVVQTNFDPTSVISEWIATKTNNYQTYTLSGNTTYSFVNGTYNISASDTHGTYGKRLHEVLEDGGGSYDGFDWHGSDFYSNSIAPNKHTTLVSGVSYTGSWIQLSLPYKLQLTGVSLTARSGAAFRSPKDVIMAGSNDNGTTFNYIDSLTFAEVGTTQNLNANATSSFSLIRMIVQTLHNYTGSIQIEHWNVTGHVVEESYSTILLSIMTISGNPEVFYIDNSANPYFNFTAGSSYIFDQSDPTNAGQQIVFGYTPDNATTLGATDGVTVMGTPGRPGAYTQLDLSAGFVGPLYYYSDASANMGMDWIVDQTYNVTVQQNAVGQYVYAFDLCGNGTYYNQPDLSFVSPYTYAFDVLDPSNNGYVLTFGTTVDVSSTEVASEYVVREGTPGVDAGARVILNLVNYSGSSLVYFEQDVSGMGYIPPPKYTVTFQSVGRQGNNNGIISTDVYVLVDDVQIAQITPIQNEYTEHSITFENYNENFTFTLKGEELKNHWERTAIVNLKINGISIIDNYCYTTGNDTDSNSIVNRHLAITNASNIGIPNNDAFYFNNLGTDPIVPTSSNPFIVVSGGVSGDPDYDIPTNHYHDVDFSASVFPVYSGITLTISGIPKVFYIDNSANPYFNFTAGSSYIFDQSDPANAGQQIVFGYTPDNTTILGVTDGVTVMGTPGRPGAYTQLDLSAGFVGPLYYYSDASANMGMDWILQDSYTVKVQNNLFGQPVLAFYDVSNQVWNNQLDLSFASPYTYAFDVSDPSNNGYVLTFGTTVDVSSTEVASEYVVREGTPGVDAGAKIYLMLGRYTGDTLVYFEDSSAGMGYAEYSTGELYNVSVVSSVFELSGTPQLQIDFTANNSYIFDQSDPANAGQQIVFGYTPDDTTILTAADGVTVMGSPGRPGAYTQLDLSAGFVGPLYYYSDASANMGMDWIVDQTYNVTVNQNAIGQYVYAFDLCGNGTTYYNQPDLSFVSPYIYKFDVSDASNNEYMLTFGTTVDVSSTVVDSEYIIRNGTPGNANASVILNLMNYIGSSLVYFEDSSAGMGYNEMVESITVDQAEITTGNIDVSTVGYQSVITFKAPSTTENATYNHNITFPSNIDINYVAVGAGGSGGRNGNNEEYNSEGGHGGFVIEGSIGLSAGTYTAEIPGYSSGSNQASDTTNNPNQFGVDGFDCTLKNSINTTIIYSEGGKGSVAHSGTLVDISNGSQYNSSFTFDGVTYDRGTQGKGGYPLSGGSGTSGNDGKTITSIPGINSITLGGGGGGSAYNKTVENGGTGGSGGAGGGGKGCDYKQASIGSSDGVDHTGGGGGGGSCKNGTSLYPKGGSGVMYIWGNFSVNMSTITYTVTVLNPSFYLSNAQKPQVNFTASTSYIFDQSDPTNAGEQIVFGTSADNKDNLYTTGVTIVGSPGRPGAYTQIEVPSDFVGTLYYYSLNTTEMGYS